ncbi:RUN and FYVE domain-containing protein 2-like [Watersipora subatra]|uniref:RUN and FYVE domain-containing protein 2-like n=1 Tax=Watersipora subatra TaxID=2589382 RepID=UPI00355BF5D8
MSTTHDLSDNSPVYYAQSSRLQMLVDDDWPQPVILTTAESEKADKKAKRRIRKNAVEIGRDNLMTIFKLVSKELMDSSLVHHRLLDDAFVPLQQFFTILEHIFIFLLKEKKLNLRSSNREFYAVLELVQRYCPEAGELSHTVKEASNIKTPLGKARAWLRLAMMQKKLAEYVNILIDKKDVLRDYYEDGAILLQEDAIMLHGLMVGLNCIDCHLSIRDNTRLDDPIGSIDYSLYLSEASLPGPDIDVTESDSGEADLNLALDQNRFLEEHNIRLTSTCNDMKQRLTNLQTSHEILQKEHATLDRLLKDLQTENDFYRTENNRLMSEFDRKLQVTREDVDTERQTYNTTRDGLERMHSELQKRLQEEIRNRQEMEKEVQQQINMRAETEMATRLLEKDVHEKQDLVIALRNQLDDVKGFNIELNSKHQLLESKYQDKIREGVRSEQVMRTVNLEKDKLKNRIKELSGEKAAVEETMKNVSNQLVDSEGARNDLETELRIERDWRTTIKDNLAKAEEKINSLTIQLNSLSSMEKDYEALKVTHEGLEKRYKEQEVTLTELGAQLSHSKLKHADLREVQQALKDAHWADDNEVTNCKGCEKTFGLARRKHHCRNCGDIYCDECSNQKMMLPSSSKPVRVCDNCNTILLARASKA